MSNAVKYYAKQALIELDNYWATYGYIECNRGELKCTDTCDGCKHCDLEIAWDSFARARSDLEELLNE